MNFTNPNVWGQGMWFTIHLVAITSTNPTNTIKQIKFFLNNLPCDTCKQHALQYLSTHPLEDYVESTLNNSEKIGLFIWTFKFHNAVNYRLGKPSLEWDVAYNLYLPFKNNMLINNN